MFHKGLHTHTHTHAQTHTHTHAQTHTRTHTSPSFLLGGKAVLCHMCKSQQKQILYVPVSCSPGCVVMVTELVHQGMQLLCLVLSRSFHRWVIQPISWVVSSPRWSLLLPHLLNRLFSVQARIPAGLEFEKMK